MDRRKECFPLGESSSHRAGLLAAKFARPQFPRTFVLRRRLLERLDSGAQGEVTLVSAGAGSGKTLLVAAWAEIGRAPGTVAWLSLDAYDNSPVAFFSYVLAALRGAVPVKSALAHILPGPLIDEAFVRRIADGIDALPNPVVLVLDDLHEIDDSQVLELLAFLLRHPVRQLRLVITTRVDQVLPLHRPRIRKGLLEIRAEELNFTVDEADRLFAGCGVPVTPAEVGALLERTEGWAVGLGLAARFLREKGAKRSIDAFTGAERTVAEYLNSEVLAGESAETHHFMRLTSVVDQVCGDLADTLTGDRYGHRTLERLATSHTSLILRLESQRPWFRYHRLLSDLLRHQLGMEAAEFVAGLHRTAAHWYAQQDAGLTALRHAVAARDWTLVGRLVVTRAGVKIVSVHRRPLMELLARVPADQLAATAELEMCAALLAYHRHDYDAVPGRVAQARALLAREDMATRRPTEILAQTIDAALARERGDMSALVEATTDTLNALAEVSPAQLPSASAYRAVALNNAGVGLFWMGRFGLADNRLRSGMTAARAIGAELIEINAAGHLALLKVEQGSLRDAYRHARDALDLARQRGWRTALQTVPAYVALALTSLERNNNADAQEALRDGLVAQRNDPEPTQYVALRLTEVRIRLADGQVAAARLVVQRLAEDVDGTRMPTVLTRWLVLAEAEIALSAGEPDDVLRSAGAAASDLPHIGRLATCVARAHFALGALQAAEDVLAPLRAYASDVGSAVEAWLITALVMDAQRHNNQSAEAFARAVELAQPEDMRRPFVRSGHARTAALLERHQWLAPSGSPFVAELMADLRSDPDPSPPATVPGPEGLTERELDVLRYLPTMLRNKDIARQMYVSVNTVKAHLRAVYRKLGVQHRREAVDRARELGIL